MEWLVSYVEGDTMIVLVLVLVFARFSISSVKVVLYSDIKIFLQKATFSEHEDSPSLTNC